MPWSLFFEYWVLISFLKCIFGKAGFPDPSLYLSITQSCLTLCGLMCCRVPDFSVHEIFQIRILEWVDIFYSNLSVYLSIYLSIKLSTSSPCGHKESDMTEQLKYILIYFISQILHILRCYIWNKDELLFINKHKKLKERKKKLLSLK